MRLLRIFALLLVLGEFCACAFLFFRLKRMVALLFGRYTAQVPVLNVLDLSDRAVDSTYVYRPCYISFFLLILLLNFLSIVNLLILQLISFGIESQ